MLIFIIGLVYCHHWVSVLYDLLKENLATYTSFIYEARKDGSTASSPSLKACYYVGCYAKCFTCFNSHNHSLKKSKAWLREFNLPKAEWSFRPGWLTPEPVFLVMYYCLFIQFSNFVCFNYFSVLTF